MKYNEIAYVLGDETADYIIKKAKKGKVKTLADLLVFYGIYKVGHNGIRCKKI